MAIHISNIHLKTYNRTKKKAELIRLTKAEQGQMMHHLRKLFFKKDYIATFELK